MAYKSKNKTADGKNKKWFGKKADGSFGVVDGTKKKKAKAASPVKAATKKASSTKKKGMGSSVRPPSKAKAPAAVKVKTKRQTSSTGPNRAGGATAKKSTATKSPHAKKMGLGEKVMEKISGKTKAGRKAASARRKAALKPNRGTRGSRARRSK